MSISSIEVICRPCSKCAGTEGKIKEMIHRLEMKYKVPIHYTFIRTIKIDKISKLALYPHQLPAILINGMVVSAGRFNVRVVMHQLENFHLT